MAVICPKHNTVILLATDCERCVGEDTRPMYFFNRGGKLYFTSSYASSGSGIDLSSISFAELQRQFATGGR